MTTKDHQRAYGLCQRYNRKRAPDRSECSIHLKYARDYNREHPARWQRHLEASQDINNAPWMVVC